MILDEIVEKYGNWSFMQLYNLTHLDFAYTRAWNNRKTLADDMYFEDFIDETADKEDRVSDLEFTAPAY